MARDLHVPAFIGHRWRRLRGRPRHGVDLCIESLFIGTSYGGYAILPELVTAESVVYSVGIGEDISFDLGVVERFECFIHGFDFTPRSLAWLSDQSLPERFIVHPFGVAEFDGTASFAPPENPKHVSHSVLPGKRGERVEFPVKRLATIANELGHDHIDVLKLDVEGAEYAVLDDLLTGERLPRQLMVEFHHGIAGVSLATTERAIDRLRSAGYRVFDVRPTGREFSLVLG